MAYYRLLTPNHAELNDGSKLGHKVIDAIEVNGKSLAKGQGAIRFKEVDSSGQAIQGARQYSFAFGEIINVD